MTILPDLPTPGRAVVGDWNFSDYPEDMHRLLTWSRHDAAGVVIAVEGVQFADGRVDCFVVLRPGSSDVELTAADARRMAGALLEAADSLDESCAW